MKKLICTILAVIAVAACTFVGCGVFSSAKDGKDGQDLNIYEIYEATNAAREQDGLEQLSFLDFLKEYLNYQFEYKEDDLQEQINRSLLSSVIIYTGFHYFYGEDPYYAGSGVIVDIDKDAGNAYIITNAHVMLDFDAHPTTPKEILVFLYGNDDYSHDSLENVELITYSISYDLALLKVTNSSVLKNSDARAAEFAESDDVYVGEKVYTVGNPGGVGMSVSTGIISKESEYIAVDFADGTNAENNYRVIRTDAATNAGNSGGALYDGSGRIVGIVNAKDGDAYSENMGYALCGSYVKRMWQLMRDEYLSTSGSYGIRRAVFPATYTYSSQAYYNNDTNLVEIYDDIKILHSGGDLHLGDVIKHIKIVNGSGELVEEKDITRFYHIDDVLISARDGYKIIYTVERSGNTVEVPTTPTFKNFV